MAYEKILVAYDGSEPSNRALSDAFEMVDHGLSKSVVVLSVTDPTKSGDPTFNAAARAAGVLVSMTGDEEVALDTLKAKIGEHIAGREDIVELRVAFGRPQDAIVGLAKSAPCDLIVMGSRGLGAIKGMLGSVSTAVLHAAEVPVLITK